LNFFTLTQPLTVSTAHLLYTLKEKGGKSDRKHTPYGFRNLKCENYQDYAQKPVKKFMFMNSVFDHRTESYNKMETVSWTVLQNSILSAHDFKLKYLVSGTGRMGQASLLLSVGK
jgi:hypothetical protein